MRTLIASMLLACCLLSPFAVEPVQATPAPVPGYVHLYTLGNFPRQDGGVMSREAFKAWLLSEKGMNDLLRCGFPLPIIYILQDLVRRDVWNKATPYPNGECAIVEEIVVPAGTLYGRMTEGWGTFVKDGKGVQLMNEEGAYRVAVTDRYKVTWDVHVLKACANSAPPEAELTVICTIKPPEEILTPVPVEELVGYYVPGKAPIVQINYPTRHKGSAPGLIGPVLGFLGKLFGAPRISIGNIHGGSAAAHNTNVNDNFNLNDNQMTSWLHNSVVNNNWQEMWNFMEQNNWQGIAAPITQGVSD